MKLFKKSTNFSDWVKNATDNELENEYEKHRLNFCETGHKSYEMNIIDDEISERGAKKWFEKHPENTDPHFRWTDANRWNKD